MSSSEVGSVLGIATTTGLAGKVSGLDKTLLSLFPKLSLTAFLLVIVIALLSWFLIKKFYKRRTLREAV